MKNKLLSLVLVFALLLSSIIGAFPVYAEKEVEEESVGTTYYVSALNGADENVGTSQSEAFFSLNKINEITLQPGDQVLLEAGSVFIDGFLHVKGSGNAEHPIIVDKYGEGNDPYIMTNGSGVWYQDYGKPLDSSGHKLKGDVSSSIHLQDVEYIEINNLEMSNIPKVEEVYNALNTMNRTGVSAVAQNVGTVDHIVLNNLNIHDIIGNVYDKHMNNGGIYFTVSLPKDEAATGISKYDDVLIENCTIDNVNRWGLAVGYTAYWDEFLSEYIDDDICQKYGSTNVVIRNNFINEPGGDSITTMYCFRPLVESNVSSGAARQINTTDYSQTGSGRVAAAVWAWKCKDSIFQYNEVYDTYLNQDGQAWDADYGDGLIYQYNYSHNNAGGAIMICGYQAVNTIFRYNISQNDLGGIINPAGGPTALIYNNVFYVKENVPFIRPNMAGGVMVVENNIIYNSGSTPYTELWTRQNTRATYSNNVYYNYANIPADDKFAITEDPMFVDPGKAPTTTNGKVSNASTFEGYKLQEGSPAINAGKTIVTTIGPEFSGLDFFGNIIDKKPDIGVHDNGTYLTSFDSSINETTYAVSGNNVMVPSLEKNPTSVDEFLNNITVEKNATKQVIKDGEPVARGVIDNGMFLLVTAEDESTTNYSISIKNSYVYSEEYSTTNQGNVWFYQQKASDQYENLKTVDEWNGWVTSTKLDYATVATDKKDGGVVGLLCDSLVKSLQKQGMSMAWRAPKSGEVELSFVNAVAYLRQASSGNQNTGGTVQISITKNGETVSDPISIPNDGTHSTMNPVKIKVEKGDYVRVEGFNSITGTSMSRPSIHISPIVTYQNIGDSEAPTTPDSLTASMVQPKQATIRWNASSDNVGVEGYRVYLNDDLIDNTVKNSLILKGLKANTDYEVKVVAYDLAKNDSIAANVSFKTTATNFIYSNDKEMIITAPISLPDLVAVTKDLESITIGAHFMQTSASIGSIVSFSRSGAGASHMHLYANDDTLGYELRGTTKASNINGKAAGVLTANERNSVALKANPADSTIKLFANGSLVSTTTLTTATYAMIKDIASGINAVTIGKTPREGVSNEYLFNGVIYDLSMFSSALSDEDILAYTKSDITALDTEDPEEVDLTALNETLASVAALTEADYTVDSWSALQTVVDEAETLKANALATQEEIDAMTLKLQTAVEGLKDKPVDPEEVDLTALNEKLASVTALNEADYTVASWSALQTVVDEAETLKANALATQTEVDAMTLKLQSAVEGLKEKPVDPDPDTDLDASLLEFMILEAEEQVEDGALVGVIEDVVQGFNKALKEAKDMLAKVNADPTSVIQAEIDLATKNLIDMLHRLDFKGTKGKLQRLVDQCEEYVADKALYSKATYDLFNAALEEAKTVLADKTALQDEIDKAWFDLATGFAGLRKIPNKDALKELLNKARSIDSNQYTVASFAILADATDNANTVYNDENATNKAVVSSEKAVKTALAGLVPLVVTTDGTDTDGTTTTIKASDSDKAIKVADTTTKAATSVPKTGENSLVVLLFIVLSLSCVVTVVIRKKKVK